MKILVVTGTYPASTQTFVWREARGAAASHRVTVLASGTGDASGVQPETGPERVHVSNWRTTPLFPPEAGSWTTAVGQTADRGRYGRLLAVRRRNYFAALQRADGIADVDLIHAHWTAWAEEVAIPLGRLLDVPVTCTAHDSFLEDVPSDTLRHIQNTVAAVTLVSSWARNLWVDRTGLIDRLVVVPNGVDIRPQAVRTESPFLRVINVARCVPQKRQRDLIDAIKILRTRGADCRLTIVGDGPERESLTRVAAESGVGDRCDFRGALDHEAVLSAMDVSDAFVLPSERESFGVVTAEAMAAGLPVIATNTGGSPDLVVEGATGFLVPVGDPTAIADRLTMLGRDPELCARLGRSGRERATTAFSSERHLAAMLAVWESARQSHNGRRRSRVQSLSASRT
jgi:glycosyltransferase involved in cell wall biosynthesis